MCVPVPALTQVTALVRGKGGVSGGTIASGMNIVEAYPLSELLAINTDAYYLAPGSK